MPQTTTTTESVMSFLRLLCCGTVRQKHGKAPKVESFNVKMRIGFDGKDSLIDSRNMNIKITFGSYAVLLDSDNRLVPLNCDGTLVQPLDTHRRYVVVVNTYGSSKSSWDNMRKGKNKHKHSHSHSHSHSKKKNKKKSSKSAGVKMKEISKSVTIQGGSSGSDDFTVKAPLMSTEFPSSPKEDTLPESSFSTKDFGVSISAEHLVAGGDYIY